MTKKGDSKQKGASTKGKGKAGATGRCNYCGLQGHQENVCRKKAADAKGSSDSGDGGNAKRKRVEALETSLSSLQASLSAMTIDGRIALNSLEANTSELSVSMLTSGSRRVAIRIDSGAEIPVWPETLHNEVETQSTQKSLSGEAYLGSG